MTLRPRSDWRDVCAKQADAYRPSFSGLQRYSYRHTHSVFSRKVYWRCSNLERGVLVSVVLRAQPEDNSRSKIAATFVAPSRKEDLCDTLSCGPFHSLAFSS